MSKYGNWCEDIDDLTECIRSYMLHYRGEESSSEVITKLTNFIMGSYGLPMEYPMVIDTLENL